MNDIEDVLVLARESLSGVHMDTPAEAILAKSRSQRHRRTATGLSVAGVTAGALALGLVGVLGSGGHDPAPAATTIRTAAFTLVSSTNGTDTLSLSQSQVFDPATLQQALAQDGIPALVQSGTFCTSDPAPPSDGVLTLQLPDGSPVPNSSPGDVTPVTGGGPFTSPGPSDAVTVIDPGAMPAGTELSFTYDQDDRVLSFDLVYDAAHTCSTSASGERHPARPSP